MHDTEARLARIRGEAQPRNHNARTIAALASNPGCARRAVMDAAGVGKQRLAAHVGFPASTGQSQSAIGRGNAFEAQVKANGCAELLRLLRERLALPIPEASYGNLDEVAGDTGREMRHTRTRALLARAAASGSDAGTLFGHPLLRLEVGGWDVYLELDLIAFQLQGRFHVVEIKSSSVIDGQSGGDKVAAAVIQSAVYVPALRNLLARLGIGPEAVADEVVLICPENFSNQPTAALLDVRRQLTVLRRQLARLERTDDLLAALPPGLTFDLGLDERAAPRRPPEQVAEAVSMVDARCAPECLATCEMAFYCRDEAAGYTAALGHATREELGGIEHITTALRLARGELEPDDAQADAAAVLCHAARLRAEFATAGLNVAGSQMNLPTGLARAGGFEASRAQPVATDVRAWWKRELRDAAALDDQNIASMKGFHLCQHPQLYQRGLRGMEKVLSFDDQDIVASAMFGLGDPPPKHVVSVVLAGKSPLSASSCWP